MSDKRGWFIVGLAMIIVLGACSSGEADTAKSEENVDQTEGNEEKSTVREDAVVMIEEEIFDEADLVFYSFIEEIEIESGRYYDLLELDGEEAANRNIYWDEQLDYLDNVNVQLQNLIEIYAMRLLAEEKHYDVPIEKLDAGIAEFKENIAEIDTVQIMIQEYDEAKFNRYMQDYTRNTLLRDRVVNDLEEELKVENPEITDSELNYLLGQRYEDLFMEQMNELELKIFVE